MNRKLMTLMLALAFAAPAVAREANSGGGKDDPAGDNSGGGGSGGGSGGSGSGGGSVSGGSWTRVRSDLVRDAAASDADVAGHVEVRTRTGRERFQVEADHLDAGVSVEFFVADGSDALVSLGSLTTDSLGEAELELDTGDGASLPVGAAAVSDLAGRRVEVRDAAGGVLLAGTVPSLSGSPATVVGRTRITDDSTGTRVKVEMKVKGRDGRQEFKVEVKNAPAGSTIELFIDDGAGTMVLAASGARIRLDSRKGHAMPLGVASLSDLSGRAFEVRVDGTTVASGNLPQM